MRTIGYRGARNSYTMNSAGQFGIPSNMESLRVEWRIPPEVTMGKIERVRLYLKRGRRVDNVFLIDRHFALYYLADEPVAVANPMDLTYATPTKNIQDKLGFISEEVLIVQSNNKVELFWKDVFADFPIGWLFGSFFRLADGPRALKFNEELREESWSVLPPDDDTILGGYQRG